MAPAPRRARNDKRVDSDNDESDSEVETPRPQKLRKRVSEAYIPDGAHPQQQEAGFTVENGQRVPLKSVNINDDEAEKRRRRKSAKMTGLEKNAIAGPSSEGNAGATADADASRAGQSKRQQPLNAVGASQAPPKPSKELMATNFEEWMKMATDNKINAANSWSFALIDYFHDMSLLRNNDDNSINFQRASSTLDGCVKIWTSRVDSVGTETGKLMSNLASGGKADDDEGEDEENPEDGTQAKKKKTSRPTNTLAKDYNSLTTKKLELEFSVDPLFKKTCADFDEGGAGGLLLNHLSLGLGSDGGMRVIFDASDSVFKEETDETDAPEDLVDISELRAAFLPDFSILDDKVISHSLATFSFNTPFDPDDETIYTEPPQFTIAADVDDDDDDDDDYDGPGHFDMDVDNPPPAEDFFVGDEAITENHDNYPADGGGDDYGGEHEGGGSEDGMGGGANGGGASAHDGSYVPFDPRNANRELVMTGDGDEGALAYFDMNLHKNWAGPEHFKLRKPPRRPVEGESSKAAPKAKKKTEPPKIDFTTPSDQTLKEMAAELFAPVGKGQSINLPGPGVGGSKKKGAKRKRDAGSKKDEHLLPDDMHFSSKQLVTLFLKPKFQLKMRGKRAKVDVESGEIDNQFWAQTAHQPVDGPNDDEDNPTFDDGPGEYNDDFDDPEAFEGPITVMGGESMSVDAGEQDLLAATAGQERKVKPEFVNYAKKAKRVDVRRLKQNIWNGLDIVIVDDDDDDDHGARMDVDGDHRARAAKQRSKSQKPPTDPSEARQFSQVISGLQKSYPREKLEEISTSFCFICLLHLANEQGLKLENKDPDKNANLNGDARRGRSAAIQSQGDDEVRDSIIPDDEDDLIAAGVGADENAIGDIWGIKIYRDPTASRSA